MRVHYAIAFVSDMSRSIAFYRDVLGIPLRFESPEWTEFETDGATLALHKTGQPASQELDDSSKPAGSCRPGFQVESLDEFHQRMMEYNVHCKQPPTESFGARIAQYADPDGLLFSVSEARAGK
jgi:lactoylglutathione lyase